MSFILIFSHNELSFVFQAQMNFELIFELDFLIL